MIGYALSIWAVAAVGGYLPYIGEYQNPCRCRTSKVLYYSAPVKIPH